MIQEIQFSIKLPDIKELQFQDRFQVCQDFQFRKQVFNVQI